ncbi:DUF4254 domain-containing protein [Nocardia sp. NBC_00881]|uniref:DUF4254 domain-containing protein n=1 Tax=Nocardia sp. NBC_00881 TaxID=2975995 RepID=UPI0038699FEE|nr:DUF4254 domain-containing protein [Nocardia sp. NBC_00881]
MDELLVVLRRRHRGWPVERTTAHRVEPLLPAEELLCGIRGNHVGGHPLAQWASLLAGLYRSALLANDAVLVPERRCARGDLVHRIDVWTEQHVPQHRHGVALHTETLGSVIDHIAAAQVRADDALMACASAGDPRVHAAWHRLAELVDGYNDLTTQVVRGVRRLPVPAGEDW